MKEWYYFMRETMVTQSLDMRCLKSGAGNR